MNATEISGEIFNVGSQNRIRILDLAARIRELTASDSKVTFIPYEDVYETGIEDMLHRIPAIAKVYDAIGWSPTYDLEGILADVIDHARTAPVTLETGSGAGT
jgi:UDP-glucose 4-epimerase